MLAAQKIPLIAYPFPMARIRPCSQEWRWLPLLSCTDANGHGYEVVARSRCIPGEEASSLPGMQMMKKPRVARSVFIWMQPAHKRPTIAMDAELEQRPDQGPGRSTGRRLVATFAVSQDPPCGASVLTESALRLSLTWQHRGATNTFAGRVGFVPNRASSERTTERTAAGTDAPPPRSVDQVTP